MQTGYEVGSLSVPVISRINDCTVVVISGVQLTIA